MWPHGIQPKTQKPDINIDGDLISIKSKTVGASNAFIISDRDFEPSLDDGWKLYNKPVMVNKSYIYIISTRIGFKDSDITKIKL